METSFNQRFTTLLNHYNLKAREAARLLKMDRQKVEGYTRDQLPRYDSIVSIIEGFPQIDVRWLLLGHGSMFESNSSEVMEQSEKYHTALDVDLIKRYWEADRNELMKLRDQNRQLVIDLQSCMSTLIGKAVS